MEKQKTYYPVKFSSQTISSAYKQLLKYDEHRDKFAELFVVLDGESWNFDSAEEFYSEIPKAVSYRFDDILRNDSRLIVNFSHNHSRVVVSSKDRSVIQEVFNVFEKNLESEKIVITQEPIKIFIGHGRDSQWRELKDHLQDKHGFQICAYEIGPRAGMSVKEVLESLEDESNFAVLVMTGEDIKNDGSLHARENVIHEIGLFQAKLGFTRAIVLKEDDVEEFSNILGINQIRFKKGVISTTFGDILATIRREFENSKS